MSHKQPPHGLTKFDRFIKECLHGAEEMEYLPPTFGRLGSRNPITGLDLDEVIKRFSKALHTLSSDEIKEGTAPAGQTFFGQFIDHDITLDVTSQIGRLIDPAKVRNFRTPSLDLDNVYGSGPEASPHLYSKKHGEYLYIGTPDNPWDLARNWEGRAVIGDPRNDENGLVSQIQSHFIQFANIAHHLAAKDPALFAHTRALCTPQETQTAFEASRMMVRWHYQWLVMHDFLPSFVDPAVVDEVAWTLRQGNLPLPFKPTTPSIPVEFAVAGFRFGHATIQPEYQLNPRTRKGLFELGAFSPLAKSSVIDIEQFFDVPRQPAKQKARPIGLSMAKPLFELPFVNDPIHFDGHVIPLKEARSLIHRNVFRDRLSLSVESGEAMAIKMGFEPRPDLSVLADVGITKMPLWLYILGEAEDNGGKLTGVGGRLVATVLLRLLQADPNSIWYHPEFQPIFGSGCGEDYTVGHLLHWIREHRDEIDFWEDLHP